MNTHFVLNYRQPFLIAVTFHVILLLLFLFRFHFNDTSRAPSPSTEIVQATLVTTQPTATTIDAIKPQQTAPEPKLLIEETQSSVALPHIEPEKSALPDKPLPEKAEPQAVADEALLLEKTEQTRENTLKKAALEKQKQQKQLKKEHQQKLQAEIQKQLEKEQQQQHQTQVKKQQKEIERLLQQDLAESSSTKANVKRSSTAAKSSSALAGVDNKEIDHYKSLIVSAISHQWIVPENLPKGLECRLKVKVAPGGVVMDVILLKSSGDPALDRSARAAVYKASPLPVPKNTTLFNEFREFNLTVRPEGILAD